MQVWLTASTEAHPDPFARHLEFHKQAPQMSGLNPLQSMLLKLLHISVLKHRQILPISAKGCTYDSPKVWWFIWNCAGRRVV